MFLLALLVVRGVPALVYRPVVGTRGAVAAGLLQATSLPFIVAAHGHRGQSIGAVTRRPRPRSSPPGLLSALVFPIGRRLARTSEPLGERRSVEPQPVAA